MKFSEYKPNWPHWAPPELCQQWEKMFAEYIDGCEQEQCRENQDLIKMTYYEEPSLMDLIDRMLTNPEMEEVWQKIEKLNIKPDLFLGVLQLAYLGPQGIDKRTPPDQKKWADKVQSLSLELAGLLEFTELDDYLRQDFTRAEMNYIANKAISFGFDPICTCNGKAKGCTKRFPYAPPRLPDMLRKLSVDAKRLVDGDFKNIWAAPEYKIYLPAPGKDEAAHLYFIRYLSRFFFDETKGTNPFREYVKICAEVAYGRRFSVRSIGRIANRKKLL